MRQDRGGRRDFGASRSFAPVKVGDEIDVKIEAVGEKGDGIGKVSGFVIFVPGTEVGKTYKIRITRVLQKVAFAEVIGEGSSDSSAEQPQSDDSSESQEPSEGSQESDQQEPSDSDSDNFGEEGEEETQ
ncbi:MAG TPA: TRAM domain-containing protein [Candidatus Nanoarchaeia archaeon]|nr:TRAM domain-containing protein [Candidatus Nanoarchaeia archaeon]